MTFTYEDVIEAAREVVAEKGASYSYEYPLVEYEDEETGEPHMMESPECLYAAPDGAPSCIVGHVVAKLDAEAFEQLKRAEIRYGAEVAGKLTKLEYLPEDFWDVEAETAMAYAQAKQDSGRPWGEALDAAEAAERAFA